METRTRPVSTTIVSMGLPKDAPKDASKKASKDVPSDAPTDVLKDVSKGPSKDAVDPKLSKTQSADGCALEMLAIAAVQMESNVPAEVADAVLGDAADDTTSPPPPADAILSPTRPPSEEDPAVGKPLDAMTKMVKVISEHQVLCEHNYRTVPEQQEQRAPVTVVDLTYSSTDAEDMDGTDSEPSTPTAAAVSEEQKTRDFHGSITRIGQDVAAAPSAASRECLVCGAVLADTATFRLHMLDRHMRPQPYTCMLCWKTFSTARDLIRHTDSNCKETLYKCQRCDRVWSSDHHHAACPSCAAAEEEEDDASAPFSCAECGKAFKLLRQLISHVKEHPDSATPFKCRTCGQCFKACIHLMIHARQHSPFKKSSPRAPPASQPAQRSPKNGMMLPANAANDAPGQYLLKQEQLDIAMKHSDPGEDVEDMDDDLGVRPVLGEDEDVDVDGDPEGGCHDHPAKDPARQQVEQVEPTVWKRFHCPACPRVFRFNHQVNVHLRKHTGERPYGCRLCEQSFPQSNHLRRHLIDNHGLQGEAVGEAVSQALQSMLNQLSKLMQREKFTALSAFLAKQGGLKGFGPDAAVAGQGPAGAPPAL